MANESAEETAPCPPLNVLFLHSNEKPWPLRGNRIQVLASF